MKKLILYFMMLVSCYSSQAQTRISPADIQWNPDFRAVTENQIKFWNKGFYLQQGKGVQLTTLNDSTILIDVTVAGTTTTTPTTPTLPTNQWIIPAASPQRFGVFDGKPGNVTALGLFDAGNLISVEYGKSADYFFYHGSSFRNGLNAFGPTIKAKATEPSKPALVLESAVNQRAYVFAWTGPAGDTLGGIDANGDLVLTKPLPEYSSQAAALTAKKKVGTLYRTGDFVKIVR